MKRNRILSGVLTAALLLTTAAFPAGAVESKANDDTLDQDLLLHAAFEGDASDSSGSGYHGTSSGTGVSYVDSPFGTPGGKAVKIINQNAVSGSGDDNAIADSYIDFGSDLSQTGLGANSFTMAFWYRSDGTINSYSAFLSNKDYKSGANKGFALGYYGADSKMNVVPANGGKAELKGIDLSQPGWHHVAVAISAGNRMRVYLDGVETGTPNTTASLGSGTIHAGYPLILGAGGTKKNPVTNLVMDDLRIYSRSLTASDVTALYERDAEKADAANQELEQQLVLTAAKEKLTAAQAFVGKLTPNAVYTQAAITAITAQLTAAAQAVQEGMEYDALLALLNEADAAYQRFQNGTKPLASFHLVSDVHISDNTTDAAAKAYEAALVDMSTLNTDTNIAFINGGDFTNYSQPKEYKSFYDLTAARDKTALPDEETLILLGNHDVRGNPGTNQGDWNANPFQPEKCVHWEESKALYQTYNAPYMPSGEEPSLFHAKTLGGYTFLVLNTELGLKDAMYMTQAQVEWLDKTMAEAYLRDPGKPIFVICHQPLNDTHWRSNILNGFDGIGYDGKPNANHTGIDVQVKEILAKYQNGVFLSGHIHNGFGVAEVMPRTYGLMVEIPSFNGSENGEKSRGIGYEVYIYEKTLAFRARNFATGVWLPEYDVVVDWPSYTQTYQAAAEVIAADKDYYSRSDYKKLTAALTGLEAELTKEYDQTVITGYADVRPPARYLYHADSYSALTTAQKNLTKTLADTPRLETPKPDSTFQDLQENWRSYLLGGTGSDLNLSGDGAKAYVNKLVAQAAGYWNTMATSDTSSRYNLWSDLDMTPINNATEAAKERSGNVTSTFGRLNAIALAWATKGGVGAPNPFYHDIEVRDELIRALDFMVAKHYPASGSKKGIGNWYHWEISSPANLLNTVMVLYDELTLEQVKSYAEAAKWYSPLCSGEQSAVSPHSSGPIMTAANTLLKANAVAQAGILLQDENMLNNVKEGVKRTLVYNDYATLYSKDADGFYADGSFIQHQGLAYITGYGADLYNNLGVFLVALNGSDWEIQYDDNAEYIAYDFVFSGVEPFLYSTRAMDLVSGRDITRKESYDRERMSTILSALMPLRGKFPTEAQNKRFDSMMKYYLSQEPLYYYANMESITSIQIAEALVNDSSVTPRFDYTLTKTFAMDKTLHITKEFGFALSLHSSRTYGHELINDEGKRTWNISDGMFYLYDADEGQYGDGYWATIDPTRLPGITAEHVELGVGKGDRSKNLYDWTGGASLEGFGVAGTHMKTLSNADSNAQNASNNRSGTEVRKSYFLFDDRILMLGSDITSATGKAVETIVDNRKLTKGNTNLVTVDGKAAALSATPTELNPTWLHLTGNVDGADVGYYFPGEDTSIQAIRETRTGDWSAQGTSSGKETNSFATFWFDHGKNPKGEHYEYVLLPGRTAAQTQAYAAAPDVEILRNDSSIHAAQDKKNGVTAANFWSAEGGSVAGVTVDREASVILRRTGDALQLAVSDPTQRNGVITVTLSVPGDVTGTDTGITVLQTEPFVRFTVDTAQLGGGSRVLSLNVKASQTRELVSTVTVIPTRTVPANTSFQALNLPESAVFSANDMKEYTLALTWSRNGYIPSENNRFTVIGTPVLTEGFANTAGVRYHVTVIQGTPEPGLVAESDGYVEDGPSADKVKDGGTGEVLHVKLDNSGYYRKAVFRFNLEHIPANRQNYTLALQLTGTVDNGFQGASLYQVGNTWAENSVTWNTLPARSSETPVAAITKTNVSGENVVYLDVTSAVTAALAKGETQISFVLEATGTKDSKNMLMLHSRESTTGQKPTLSWGGERLEETVGNKENLQFLVDVAAKLDAASFTNYSADAFAAALTQAQQVLRNDAATLGQINDAEDALLVLLLTLRAKPVPTPSPES